MPFERFFLFDFNFRMEALAAGFLLIGALLMTVLLRYSGGIDSIFEDPIIFELRFPAELMVKLFFDRSFRFWRMVVVGAFGVGSSFKDLAFFGEITIKLEFQIEILLCHAD